MNREEVLTKARTRTDDVKEVNKYALFDPDKGDEFYIVLSNYNRDREVIDPFYNPPMEGQGDMKRTGAIYESWDYMYPERDMILSRKDDRKVKIDRELVERNDSVYVVHNSSVTSLKLEGEKGPKNWSRGTETNNQVMWTNTTDYSSVVEAEKVPEGWKVTYKIRRQPEEEIDTFGSREVAVEEAKKWMRNHPNP